MARSARMFEIIQILRSAPHPLRAQDIADELEVTKRTIYRDIASLQAMRVPIEGAAGIGYVLRSGYDLPPVNFDIEEVEAISVGLSLIARTGDKSLQKAAASAARKLSEAAPPIDALRTSDWGIKNTGTVDAKLLRDAIRKEQKLRITYEDSCGDWSVRVIQPIALTYYIEVLVLAAWCETRADYRHFRPDRIQDCTPVPGPYKGRIDSMRAEWSTLNDG